MAGKYSGAFIPGQGGGDDDESAPPPKRLTLQEKYGDWQEEKAKDKARLEIWMNGREPSEWWEHGSGPPPQSFFCMEFPTTPHYMTVAWEKGMSLPHKLDGEMGRLRVWCFGCKSSDCGACRWTRKAYAAAVKRELKGEDTKTDDLPF